MSTKKSLQSRIRKTLTKTEIQIFNLITKEFLNRKQIEQRLKCSRQNVSKHVRNIINKGYLNSGNQPTNFCQPNRVSTCQPNNLPSLCNDEKIRVHGDEWHINILWKDNSYNKLLKKCNTFQLSGHTIRLFENVIEVYGGEGISFYGKDENEAERKALDYWYGFFSRLEMYTKTTLVKNGSSNIKRVNSHFASIDSEICENYLKEEGKKIKVFCPIDGKLAYITDESWGDKEDECVHPKTAKRDRGNVSKQIDDWRLNDPKTNSQIDKELGETKGILLESAKQIKENAENQGIYGDNSVTHVGLMKAIKSSIKSLDERGARLEERDKKLLVAIERLGNRTH